MVIQQFHTTILMVAVAYYLVGWLSTLLAVQPWPTALVWPVAGIALAAILLLEKSKRTAASVAKIERRDLSVQ